MNVNKIIEYAGTIHGYREVVTYGDNDVFRYTYKDMWERVKKMAGILSGFGVREGEVVTIFAANTHRSVEVLFAAPGLGATVYSANSRIPFEHLVYCVNHVTKHAPHRLCVVEPHNVELVRQLVTEIGPVFEKFMILGSSTEGLDVSGLGEVVYSEDLLTEQPATFQFDEVDENTAAIIMFTTGTTGMPKPIAHSHRMVWLHSVGMCASLSMNAMDSVLVLPALSHLGWVLWAEAPFMGAKMVLPGADPKPMQYVDMILDEKVTFSAAVPTLFAMMLEEFRSRGVTDLQGMRIYFAGQATPEAIIKAYDGMGADARQLFGFSEAGPHFVENAPRPLTSSMSQEEYTRFKRESAGFPACGTTVKIFDDAGNELPWDGETPGAFGFKGLWATSGYWLDPQSTSDGKIGGDYLQVGDVCRIDSSGNVFVLDRSKDAIKSGGEWIPTPLLEDLIMRHPGINEAAVVGIPHPKWVERPLALVLKRRDYAAELTENQIKEFLLQMVDTGELNKWWIPDRVLVVDEIPRTSVGKFDKKTIRDTYQNVLVDEVV